MAVSKADIIDSVAKATGMKKVDVDKAVSATLQAIMQSVKEDGVSLLGFGAFKASKRAARTGRNPATGKEIKIPARVAITFKPGKAFKEMVN